MTRRSLLGIVCLVLVLGSAIVYALMLPSLFSGGSDAGSETGDRPLNDRAGWCCAASAVSCTESANVRECLGGGGRAFDPDKARCDRICGVGEF